MFVCHSPATYVCGFRFSGLCCLAVWRLVSSISGTCGHVRDPKQQQDLKLALLMLFVLPREAAAYKVPHLHDAVVSASFLSWWRARG